MKVVRKHNNSKYCFVCGLDNEKGLKTRYYEMENEVVVGVCSGDEMHNSYQGRMHGGVISALLDEVIGRAVNIMEPDAFGVTTDLQIKFKMPVPLGETIYSVGKIIKNNRFLFEGIGVLTNNKGQILATGHAKYFKMDITKITDESFLNAENWYVEENLDDPKEIMIDEKVMEFFNE